MAPYLEILHPDGSAERFPLAGERVVVGRQPREGIAIPTAGELELEHMMLSARADGCWFSIAHGARTPAMVGGQYFGGGMLPWGSAVHVGSLWLKVMDTEVEAVRPPPVSLTSLLLIVGLLGAAAWLFLAPVEVELPPMTKSEPPELFAAEPPACPETQAAAAAPRAREAADAARAKSERYPFAAQDGIRAVELYGLAARCFAAAGSEREAAAASRDRSALITQIQEDYRTHRLKLERALQYRRTREALTETRELLSLVAHLDHPYTTWLRSMERRIRIKAKEPSK